MCVCLSECECKCAAFIIKTRLTRLTRRIRNVTFANFLMPRVFCDLACCNWTHTQPLTNSHLHTHIQTYNTNSYTHTHTQAALYAPVTWYKLQCRLLFYLTAHKHQHKRITSLTNSRTSAWVTATLTGSCIISTHQTEQSNATRWRAAAGQPANTDIRTTIITVVSSLHIYQIQTRKHIHSHLDWKIYIYRQSHRVFDNFINLTLCKWHSGAKCFEMCILLKIHI